MMRSTWLLLASALLVSSAAARASVDNGGSSSAGGAAHPIYSTVEPGNAFGYALVGEVARGVLSRDVNQNLLLSPASAATALQMLLNGAGTATYSEMAKVLHLDTQDLDSINKSNHSLLDYFTSLSHAPVPPVLDGPPPVAFTLSMANSAWSNSKSGFQFKPEFLSTLQKSYDAVARVLDFTASNSAAEINQWASDQTNGKIPRVIDAKSLAQLSFILMNATYFKANWQDPFQLQNTRKMNFTRGDGSRSMVDTMQTRLWGYVEVAGNEVMELPYEGGSASMYIVLPAEGRKLADVLADTTGPLTEGFWSQVSQASPEEADFSLPKFSFNNALDLGASLKSLGMRTLFSPSADLSATGSPNVSVSAVTQNTFINVDEHGTEAAAVTTIAAGGAAHPVQPLHDMIVNRPFLISIVEKKSQSVLFLGEVSNP